MKYPLIFALALFQTALPVPRKTANDPAKNSHNEQAHSADQKKQATQPSKGTTGPQPQISTSGGSQQTTKQEQEAVPMRVAPVDVNKDWSDYLSIIANLLLTVATLAIAIYAAIQAKAAKRSADAYEKTVRLTERADVLLEAASIKTAYQDRFDAHSRVQLRFKNFGRTRANNLKIDVKLTLPYDIDEPHPQIPAIVLGAGDGQTVTFQSFGETLTQETFRRVCDGTLKWGFIGSLRYQDVFDNWHTTNFRADFNSTLRAFVQIQNVPEADKQRPN